MTKLFAEKGKYIAQKTFNTWQSGRTFDQELNDTIVGKIAEKAIKEYFYQQCKDNFNPYIAFYDDFREDNFNNHNEIDFIFSKSIDQLLNAQAYIQKHLTNSKLKSHKSKFINNDVFICEIKSTRIPAKSDRLKTNGSIDIDKILDDDFLSYPFFKRTSSTINNKDDYIREISGELKLSEQEIMNIEEHNLIDWYFRVYIDTCDDKYTAYIIGALPKDEFIKNFNIKKMYQINKSENAIYLSTPLRNGVSIKDFMKNNIKMIPFKNHLSTIKNNNTNMELSN